MKRQSWLEREHEIPLVRQCELTGVARSTLYAQRQRPWQNRGRTGAEPGQNRGRTGAEPGQNRGRTGAEPGQNRGRTVQLYVKWKVQLKLRWFLS